MGHSCIIRKRGKLGSWNVKYGHVLSMLPSKLPRKAVTWLPTGKRHVGRPRATWRRIADVEGKE